MVKGSCFVLLFSGFYVGDSLSWNWSVLETVPLLIYAESSVIARGDGSEDARN